jgi:hypothetical protein
VDVPALADKGITHPKQVVLDGAVMLAENVVSCPAPQVSGAATLKVLLTDPPGESSIPDQVIVLAVISKVPPA